MSNHCDIFRTSDQKNGQNLEKRTKQTSDKSELDKNSDRDQKLTTRETKVKLSPTDLKPKTNGQILNRKESFKTENFSSRETLCQDDNQIEPNKQSSSPKNKSTSPKDNPKSENPEIAEQLVASSTENINETSSLKMSSKVEQKTKDSNETKKVNDPNKIETDQKTKKTEMAKINKESLCSLVKVSDWSNVSLEELLDDSSFFEGVLLGSDAKKNPPMDESSLVEVERSKRRRSSDANLEQPTAQKNFQNEKVVEEEKEKERSDRSSNLELDQSQTDPIVEKNLHLQKENVVQEGMEISENHIEPTDEIVVLKEVKITFHSDHLDSKSPSPVKPKSNSTKTISDLKQTSTSNRNISNQKPFSSPTISKLKPASTPIIKNLKHTSVSNGTISNPKHFPSPSISKLKPFSAPTISVLKQASKPIVTNSKQASKPIISNSIPINSNSNETSFRISLTCKFCGYFTHHDGLLRRHLQRNHSDELRLEKAQVIRQRLVNITVKSTKNPESSENPRTIKSIEIRPQIENKIEIIPTAIKDISTSKNTENSCQASNNIENSSDASENNETIQDSQDIEIVSTSKNSGTSQTVESQKYSYVVTLEDASRRQKSVVIERQFSQNSNFNLPKRNTSISPLFIKPKSMNQNVSLLRKHEVHSTANGRESKTSNSSDQIVIHNKVGQSYKSILRRNVGLSPKVFLISKSQLTQLLMNKDPSDKEKKQLKISNIHSLLSEENLKEISNEQNESKNSFEQNSSSNSLDESRSPIEETLITNQQSDEERGQSISHNFEMGSQDQKY